MAHGRIIKSHGKRLKIYSPQWRSCDIEEMRELAGKIDDGHADKHDVNALADEVLNCFGDLNNPKKVKIISNKRRWR